MLIKVGRIHGLKIYVMVNVKMGNTCLDTVLSVTDLIRVRARNFISFSLIKPRNPDTNSK